MLYIHVFERIITAYYIIGYKVTSFLVNIVLSAIDSKPQSSYIHCLWKQVQGIDTNGMLFLELDYNSTVLLLY
jgi:hypothetical protein